MAHNRVVRERHSKDAIFHGGKQYHGLTRHTDGVGVGCSDESDVIGDEIAVHGPRDVLEFGNFKFIELDGLTRLLGSKKISGHVLFD